MRYDAVLFDLDGTLTASAPGIYSSVRYAAEKLGRPVPDEAALRRFVGPSMHDSMQDFAGLTAEEAHTAVSIYREHYVVHGVLNATVYPGIPNMLRQLKAAGVYLAIATAKPISSAQRVLSHFGLARFFDRVIGASDDRTETSKLSLVREALPARYTRAAMVGDRRYDMEAAKQAGIDAIGAGWGYGSTEELAAAGADAIIEKTEDLALSLLGKKPASARGFFISVEGLDGSGKTTQMNAAAEHIRALGYEVLLTREPGGTPVSEEIRSLVLDPRHDVSAQTEALLYAAARAQHVCDVILPALAQGRVVLCDRYVDSSIAYQGAGRELGVERVSAINAFATQGTLPDLTLLLVVDAQTAFLRRNSATPLDRLERSGEAFFVRVYDAYAKMAKNEPERIRCIDAQRDIESVSVDVRRQVDRMLQTR